MKTIDKNPSIRIPFARPSINELEVAAVKKVLESGWLTTGQETIQFEQEFADILNNNNFHIYTRAVQSATAGLHLCLNALGISHNMSVITTPFTFVATASAILYNNARPIFVDCKENSPYIDEKQFEAIARVSSAQAFLPVHIAGYMGDNFATLLEIAQHYNLTVVEDAAHTFPACYDDDEKDNEPLPLLGTLGDAGVYSFYPNKTITTAEGGMIACKDEKIAKKISSLRNHGIDRTIWDRFRHSPMQHEYDIETLGYKYNLPDILSAIGRVQLQKAFYFQKLRKKAALYYISRLSNRDYLHMPAMPKNSNAHSWHLFIIRITHPQLSRDDFIKKLSALGIGTSVHYKPLHLMSFYKNKFGYNIDSFPNANKLYQESISLPIYPDISEDALEEVCNAIITIGDKYL